MNKVHSMVIMSKPKKEYPVTETYQQNMDIYNLYLKQPPGGKITENHSGIPIGRIVLTHVDKNEDIIVDYILDKDIVTSQHENNKSEERFLTFKLNKNGNATLKKNSGKGFIKK